jgi:hypothetical protein
MRRAALGLVLLVSAGCSAAAPPTPTPTPYVAPTPTPFVGSGLISFGTGLDEATLTVTGGRSSFPATTKAIAYSGEFSQIPGATTLEFLIAKRSSSGTETQVYKNTIDLTSPESVFIGDRFDLGALVGRHKGTYVLRFVLGGTILAEGQFILT